VAKQTFQLARCGCTLRVTPQNINLAFELRRYQLMLWHTLVILWLA
jgi:hypothetical protein